MIGVGWGEIACERKRNTAIEKEKDDRDGQGKKESIKCEIFLSSS